jgi:hypothetical protein
MSTSADAFVQGWGKLPDELKLDIVRYTLRATRPSLVISLTRNLTKLIVLDSRPANSRFPMHPSIASELELLEAYDSTFLSLLVCSETAIFVHEAFYTQNTMRLTHPRTPMLPPPSVQGFVRHVKLYADTSISWWNTIIMVANGGTGFLNLHVVEVELIVGWY